MVAVGPQNQYVLCLDCWGKFTAIHTTQMETAERLYNFAAAQMDYATGLPELSPRIPPRQRPVILAGNTVLNNIKIANSQVGVVNTGTIGTIDSAISLVRDAGESEIAGVLKTLTEAIANDASVEKHARDSALELVSAIATEAATPRESRRAAVARALVVDFSQVISGAGAASQLWINYAPIIKAFFGIGDG